MKLRESQQKILAEAIERLGIKEDVPTKILIKKIERENTKLLRELESDDEIWFVIDWMYKHFKKNTTDVTTVLEKTKRYVLTAQLVETLEKDTHFINTGVKK